MLIESDGTDIWNKANLYTRLARLLSRWNLREQSEAAYKTAIELDSDDDRIRYSYGIFLENGQSYDLALTQFKKAMELDSTDVDHILECGYCYAKMDANDNAKEMYLKALEMDPNNSSLHTVYGEFLGRNMKDMRMPEFILKKHCVGPGYCSAYYEYAEDRFY